MKAIRCIDHGATIKLHSALSQNVALSQYYKELRAQGYKFYVVDQSRGRCYYISKLITIPIWAIKRGISYLTWYIAHEMSHAYAYTMHKDRGHGPFFQQQLLRICPSEYVHHENGYKPKHLAQAMIVNGFIPDDL